MHLPFDLPASRSCPVCDHVTEQATSLDDDPTMPAPGDFSMCVNCRAFLIFEDDLHLRLATDLDFALLDDFHRNLLIRMRRKAHESAESKTPPRKV